MAAQIGEGLLPNCTSRISWLMDRLTPLIFPYFSTHVKMFPSQPCHLRVFLNPIMSKERNKEIRRFDTSTAPLVL